MRRSNRPSPSARSEAVSLDIGARIATLSPRERQVMDGLIAGLSNKLIAKEYDISPRTIEVYRANVMTKMQAGSLSELVRLAIRAGALGLSQIKTVNAEMRSIRCDVWNDATPIRAMLR